jgi:hypothetical protein
MHFRYQDASGRPVTLPTTAALLAAIQSGAVTPVTPLAVGDERTWQPAGSVAAYREAADMLDRLPAGHALRTPGQAPSSPAAAGRGARGTAPGRRGLLVALLLVAGLLTGLGVWARGRGAGPSHAAASPGLPARVTELAEHLDDLFGNTIALALRVRQNERSALRLERRFAGTSLRSAESLRGVQSLAERFRIDADRLLVTGETTARRLNARADSLELADGQLPGLASVVADRVEEWQRDLARLAKIEKTGAAGLHAVATFLLARRQSFVVEEGRPRFLSRHDAQEYVQLWDQLTRAAEDERLWALEMQRKHPGWMTGLPEESRPELGVPLVRRR